jgi:TonB family protein
MRTWTLALSISAHAVIVVAIFVAPIFATADLPDPHRPLTFETITPIEAPAIPVTPRSQTTPPAATAQTIPLTPPPELPPDMPSSAMPPPIPGPCDSCGVVGIPVGNGAVFGDLPTPPPPPPPPPSARHEPVRIGGVIRPPTRVNYVAPVYPQIALASRQEATVILEAVIDEKGSVRELRVLRGRALFDDAAMRAVAQWQFTPTLLNGTTVPVVMTVTVSFTLQK